jgi:methyl-accepting chemotaxis protein
MEQMAANIRQNADNAQQTEKIALQAASNAVKAEKPSWKQLTPCKKSPRKFC